MFRVCIFFARKWERYHFAQGFFEEWSERMKILVIAGDYWHPIEVIKRGITKMGLDSQRYEFDFVEDAKDIVTSDFLMEHDVVVFAKSNVITAWNDAPMFEKDNGALSVSDYRSYVEKGGALLCLHAGNAETLEKTPEWCEFVGNYFITHPARCEVTVYPEKDHPITTGVENFSEVDEQYIIGGIAEDADVFLKSDSTMGGTQVAGYTRMIGKGKLCVITPGHTISVWQNKSFIKMFVNAMEWCVKG